MTRISERVPARFQSHGVVVFVDAQGTVRSVSHDCDRLLGRSCWSLIGIPLEDLLPDFDLAATSRQARDALEEPSWRVTTLAGGSTVKVRAFAATPSLDGLDIVATSADNTSAIESATVERIIRWTSRLQRTTHRTELMRVTASIAVELAGFEGVWAVRIEDDRTGFVEAASVSGDAPDTTGSIVEAIHLPPGDLTLAGRPAPFFVADVAEAANELETPPADELDLNGSALHRPFGSYLDFLASIGVRSAFAIPVVANGTTWGRIIGHHPSALTLSPAKQAELRLVGLAAGTQLQELLDKEDAAQRLALAVASARVLRGVAGARNLSEGFRESTDALLELCDASSVILSLDGRAEVLGEPTAPALVDALLRECRTRFASHHRGIVAATALPPADGDRRGGYLAMRIDDAATDLVVWIRPERRRTVQWVEIVHAEAGATGPPALGDAVAQVDRESATASEAWSRSQIEAMETFRAEVTSVIVGRYRRLQAVTTDLERSNSELDAFAHTIAHDLRAPIRGIRLLADFLIEDAADRLTAADRDQLETVLRLADRGTSLLDDLMSYARLGDATWVARPVELRVAAQEATELLGQAALAEAAIEVEGGQITADPSALRQLLVNLIGNALKYSDGPADVRVGLSTLAEARLVSEPPPTVRELAAHTPVLTVADRGVGIAPDHAPRVFGLFARANHAMPHVDGTGAGLAMCQRIAQRHGGDIWLRSEQGRGTTVFVVLSPGA
ncbi:MAG: ATP-binding protein [Patulibacter minatonensis]